MARKLQSGSFHRSLGQRCRETFLPYLWVLGFLVNILTEAKRELVRGPLLLSFQEKNPKHLSHPGSVGQRRTGSHTNGNDVRSVVALALTGSIVARFKNQTAASKIAEMYRSTFLGWARLLGRACN